MVRRIQITLSQAIEGFFLEKRAAQLSIHTLSDYSNALRKLQAYLGDPPLDQITAGQIRDFLTDLGQRAVVPAGIAPRPAKPLFKKSILNIHTALSSLWTWAVKEGFADEHISPPSKARTKGPWTHSGAFSRGWQSRPTPSLRAFTL
jgi:site-specific recombinase XerD